MNSDEKDEVMKKFSEEKLKFWFDDSDRVGVDVPSANIIVIEHTEKFGLAQLHQLRGRV